MSEQEFNSLFSSNLNRYLRFSNKTQADLAKFVGVSTASVSNWCNGVKLPRMDKVDKICTFFCIKRSDLMDPPEDSVEDDLFLSDLEKVIIKKFRLLNDSERSMFLRTIGITETEKLENLA
jgi:transcriptional regulator with XRE-family HTH domain